MESPPRSAVSAFSGVNIHPRLPGEASYKLLCTSCVLFYLILTIADQINTSIDSICGRLNQATNSLAFLPQRDEREITSSLKLCGLLDLFGYEFYREVMM